MARDYTKYNVEGVGSNLNKARLVQKIIEHHASSFEGAYQEFLEIWFDNLQGGKGVCKALSEIDEKNERNYYIKEPITLSDGTKIAVCNQWGVNIVSFIAEAEKLGYKISKIENSKADSGVAQIIDLKGFSVWRLAKFFKSKEENSNELDAIDTEIEALLDKSPKYYVIGKLFEKYDFEYQRDDVDEYFSLGEDENFDEDDLLDMLRDETLLSRIIKKENLTGTKLSPDNTDFVLLFSGYFIKALELLVYREDNEMIAEFIVNQSVQTIEDEYNVETPMGDWLGDITAELIENIYGYDIKDYEGECEIEAYYFGQNHSMGYDFHSYAQDIIDSLL